MIKYLIYYSVPATEDSKADGLPKKVIDNFIAVAEVPEGWGLGDIKDGVWLNKTHQLTKESDAYQWLPPSQILRVLKVEGTEGG